VSAGRAGRPWRRAAAHIRGTQTHCWICGHPVNFAAPPRTPAAPSVDHLRPLTLGGDPTDPTNLRLAHYGCNSRRGTGQSRGIRTVTPTPDRW
jgi:5-methylcytosine-specific restriction endonuclease McrA